MVTVVIFSDCSDGVIQFMSLSGYWRISCCLMPRPALSMGGRLFLLQLLSQAKAARYSTGVKLCALWSYGVVSGNYCPVCGECYTDSDYDSKVGVELFVICYRDYWVLEDTEWYSVCRCDHGCMLADEQMSGDCSEWVGMSVCMSECVSEWVGIWECVWVSECVCVSDWSVCTLTLSGCPQTEQVVHWWQTKSLASPSLTPAQNQW